MRYIALPLVQYGLEWGSLKDDSISVSAHAQVCIFLCIRGRHWFDSLSFWVRCPPKCDECVWKGSNHGTTFHIHMLKDHNGGSSLKETRATYEL
jgi:hypothetical protein